MSKKKYKGQLINLDEDKKLFTVGAVQHMRNVSALATPTVLESEEELVKVCEAYFDICVRDKVKPTASTFALALGVDRKILLSWINGQNKMTYRNIIARYYGLIEAFDELALKEGEVNAIAGIFIMKNNYGWKDQTEVISATEDLTDEEIERRYRERHEIVAEVEVEKA